MLQNKDSEIGSLKTQLANAGINPNPSATSNPNANDKDAIIADLQSQLAQKTSQIDDLNNQISQKNSQIDSLNSQLTQKTTQLNDANSQLTQKNSQISSLNAQIATLNSQVSDLTNQLNTLKAPNVVKVNLKADDTRPFLQGTYLHVYGYLCNVGTNQANNIQLHVVAYQNSVKAIDTTISVTALGGEGWTNVDSQVSYTGGALTSSTVTPTWNP